MQGDQTIAYISDVGAAELKPLFVVGCVLTTVFLDISFICDRLLRHKGVLVPNTSTGEKILSGLCIFFAFVGTIGLTFLSGFDTAHYPKLHDIFLLLFIAGYLLSAVFICWEFQRLAKSKQSKISRHVLRRITLTNLRENREPSTPYSRTFLLREASLHSSRASASDRLRREQLPGQLQRSRYHRVGRGRRLQLLRLLLRH